MFSHEKKQENGFTIIECLLAIVILSFIVMSVISLQSSVINITYQSINKIKSTWAMKKTFAQVEYIIDTIGLDGLPDSKEFQWSQDESFKINVNSMEPKDLKLSDFLITAYKFYNFTTKQDSTIDIEKTLAPFATVLDQQPDASKNLANIMNSTKKNIPFLNIDLSVNWNSGKEKKQLQDTLLLINSSSFFNINIPIPNSKSTSLPTQTKN